MYNPTRRNRNIGAKKQGYGQDNELTIPQPAITLKSFYERLYQYEKEKRIINGHEFLFVTEKTRETSRHACTIDDIEKIIESIPVVDYSKSFKWSKKLSPEALLELERLRNDGHEIIEGKRSFTADYKVNNVRRTQLYRTLLHEFGHYVHYLELVERPGKEDEEIEEWGKRDDHYFKLSKTEKEKFAHNYAEVKKKELTAKGIIPFDRIDYR